MTRQEWTIIAGCVDEWWPGKFDEAAEGAWFIALEVFGAVEVSAALKVLLGRGGTFRPSAAEVIATIRKDPSAPTFPESLKLIRGALSAWNRPLRGDFANEAEMLKARAANVEARAEDVHPLVASFIATFRLEELQRIVEELGDEEYGSVRRRDLEATWARHCDATEGRELAVLASGRRGELAQFDPLRALGMKPAPALERAA